MTTAEPDDEQGTTEDDACAVDVPDISSLDRSEDWASGYAEGLRERSRALDDVRLEVRDIRTAGALLALGLALLAARALMRDEVTDDDLPRLRN